MKYLNYQIHKILQSNYKIFINLAIYTIIFLFINTIQISYCMTEGNEIPEIAEAKPQSIIALTNLEQLIHRNIDSYIGDKKLIIEQQEQIATLQKELTFIRERDSIILGDDHVADAIANRGLSKYINEICRKHGRPLSYPWIDENGNYKEDY